MMAAGEITRSLRAWGQGDDSALEILMPFVITNLRAIARRMQKPGATLNTTALVNEAYLRLAGGFEANDREHFLALVARAMRQILVDHARAQRRLKRGGGAGKATLTEASVLTDPQIEQILAIDELLDALAREHPRRRRVFEMRFFAGIPVEEAAETLGISENTVIRDYRLACVWLRFHLNRAVSETTT
jgi:RNA polymerase sigma factor (TIGR02999 family)